MTRPGPDRPRPLRLRLARRGALLSALLLLAFLWGCGPAPDTEPGPPEPAGQIPYETLSEYGFFTGELAALAPAPGVVPYDVVSPLWSDGARKERFLVLPEGGKAQLGAEETWGVPDGTVVIKSFHFPLDRRDPGGARRHIETRLLVRDSADPEGLAAYTYVWNDEQTDAELWITGKSVDVEIIDEQGTAVAHRYLVPNSNQCGNCHERSDRMELLGLVTPQLNFDLADGAAPANQLERFAAQGVFDAPLPDVATLPALPSPWGAAPLDRRARAYLHGNCSHCHRPGGGGGSSGLVLLFWEDTPAKYGVCKGSIAAGAGTGENDYDIVPGFPEDSILPFRMSSVDPQIKMPEIPNLLPDAAAVDLIEEWIAAMEPPGCP